MFLKKKNELMFIIMDGLYLQQYDNEQRCNIRDG